MTANLKNFAELVLAGGRFAAINSFLNPDILPDLKAYIEIIEAIASDIYFEKNPTKKKLPNGFNERLNVGMTRIEKGSSVSVFERIYEDEACINDEFDQARNLLNNELFLIQGEKEVENCCFSNKVIGLFSKFGKNLKKNETITIRIPGNKTSPVYSKELMSRVVSINKKPYEDVCCIHASICGYDLAEGDLFLITKDAEKIISHFPKEFAIELKDAAREYNSEEICGIFVGIAKYNADDSVGQILKLQHIVIQKEEKKIFLPDPFLRIDEFSLLEDGWFDGFGEGFKEVDLFLLKNWIQRVLDYSDFPAPYCFPSADNAIELEWSFGFWEIICTFECEKQWIFLHATNLRSKEIREDSFSIEDPSSIEKTARFLENLLKSLNKWV